MLKQQNPQNTQAWKALADHYQTMKSVHMRDLFKRDPNRFQKFSLQPEVPIEQTCSGSCFL